MPRSIQGFKPKALSQDHRFYSDDDIEAVIAAAGGTVRGRVPGLRRRQALSERLEVVAHNYAQCSQFQSEPTAKQISDAMADIEAAAAKLIAALHVPEVMDEDPIASMPVGLRSGALQAQAALEAGQLGGVGLLRDSVHGVYRLQRWAQNVQARLRTALRTVSVSVHDGTVSWNLVTEGTGSSGGFHSTAQSTPRAKRHVGDEALDRLFGDLAGIWTKLFKRRIAASISGEASANSGQGGPTVRFFSACLKPILKDKTPTSKAIRGRILLLFPRRGGAS